MIGDSHWLTDGHHKEYLLMQILLRFLPNGYICGRGFVVRDQVLDQKSKEQDLLVVDCRESAPLFFEGGVIVSFPENVSCAISVKSKLSTDSLKDSIVGLNSIPTIDSHSPILGVFAFEMSETWAKDKLLINKWLKSRTDSTSNHTKWSESIIGVDRHCVIRKQGSTSDFQCSKTGDLSTAVFIATIADFVAGAIEKNSRSVNDMLTNVEFEQIF